MSEYQNVVGGRLKLKGKALDVKEGGVKKKKTKKQHREESSQIGHDELNEGLAHLHWLFWTYANYSNFCEQLNVLMSIIVYSSDDRLIGVV